MAGDYVGSTAPPTQGLFVSWSSIEITVWRRRLSPENTRVGRCATNGVALRRGQLGAVALRRLLTQRPSRRERATHPERLASGRDPNTETLLATPTPRPSTSWGRLFH